MIRYAHYLAILVFIVLVGSQFDRKTGFISLIRFGETWQNKRLSSLQGLPISIAANSNGYDGQFYAQIAVDPLLRNTELVQVIDAPAYRARRILVPATAAILGTGSPWRTLQAYSLLNVVCWFILAWLLRTWITGNDWKSFARWAGCLFSIGVLDSVRQSLVDLPALVLLSVGIRAHARHELTKSTLWLALGNLAKETTLVGALALNIPLLRESPQKRRILVSLTIAVLPFVAWWLYVYQRFGATLATEGFGNFTWPFFGLFSHAKLCWNELHQGNFDGRYSFGLLAIIGLFTQVLALWYHRDAKSPWWRIGAAYSLLLPFLSLWVWSGYWAACRAVLPLTIAFNLLLPANRSFWPLWIAGNLSLLHAIWRFL
jgi:hypothetical protein